MTRMMLGRDARSSRLRHCRSATIGTAPAGSTGARQYRSAASGRACGAGRSHLANIGACNPSRRVSGRWNVTPDPTATYRRVSALPSRRPRTLRTVTSGARNMMARGTGGAGVSVMIEKFARACGMAGCEFLDLNHTSNCMILVSLVIFEVRSRTRHRTLANFEIGTLAVPGGAIPGRKAPPLQSTRPELKVRETASAGGGDSAVAVLTRGR